MNCNFTSFPNIAGDIFTQLSNKPDTQYAIRVTPDVPLRQLTATSFTETKVISVDNTMT